MPTEIEKAAKELYDNRLGWSDGRAPYAPREFWDRLGLALGYNYASEPHPQPEIVQHVDGLR